MQPSFVMSTRTLYGESAKKRLFLFFRVKILSYNEEKILYYKEDIVMTSLSVVAGTIGCYMLLAGIVGYIVGVQTKQTMQRTKRMISWIRMKKEQGYVLCVGRVLKSEEERA